MTGSPVTRPSPEIPAEHRFALVVATTRYADESLRELRAPAHDADELSAVLADPQVGAFTVKRVIDRSAQEVRLALEEFLTGRDPDDLLLVYLSCHGLVDVRRRLYFAATDTRKSRLAATGVESQWLLDLLEDCRARRLVVVLDCCFSGAFAQGIKGEADLGLGERFHGQGRGRVVLTASRASEYSFEGEPLPGSVLPGSVFTSALVDGIRSGAADGDNDGYISVDDAYTYAFDQVRALGGRQTPQRWLYGAEGKILLARSPAGVAVVPVDLPEALRSGLDSPHPAIRLGAVAALGEWLTGDDPARSLTARQTLEQVADSDIHQVAAAATALLEAGTADDPLPDAAAPDTAVLAAAVPDAPAPDAPLPDIPVPDNLPAEVKAEAETATHDTATHDTATYDLPSVEPSLAGGAVAPPSPAGVRKPGVRKPGVRKPGVRKPDVRPADTAGAGRPPDRPGTGRPPRSLMPRGRRGRALLAGVLALVVGAVVVVVLTSRSGGPPPTAAQSTAQSQAATQPQATPQTDPAAKVAADPALAGLVPADLKASGKLVVASDASYAPNEFKDAKGNIVGMDADLAVAIARKLGLTAEVQNVEFTAIAPGITTNAYQLGLSSFTATKEREQTVDMVTYFSAGTGMAVKGGNPDKIDPNDLCGKKVAVQTGTTQADSITDVINPACVKAGKPTIPNGGDKFDQQTDVTAAVVSGQDQVMLADSPFIAYQVKESGGGLQEIGATTDTAPYGIVVAKGSPLTKAVHGAVQSLMADGTYKAILAKWGVEGGAIDTSVINGAPG
ncbi:transporter substrate-binding domain-containing protein [Kitasatospora sp. NPDC052868]|uniref:caspase, EACC1-associated type n=1 Tax=Kitasatospora sp. NPDC052868 TaxID=3364060 RepID=UPI0037CAD504